MVYDSIGSKIGIDFDHYILVAVNRYVLHVHSGLELGTYSF